MSVRQVSYSKVLAALDLIEEYGAECSIPAIGEIKPQGHIYAALEASGVLRCFGVFQDDEMVGFAFVLTPILPHYGKKVATIESLFISKGKSGGMDLMWSVEEYAKECGCVGILYSAPVGGRLERLLAASKPYQRTNAVFYRRFDACA